LINLFKNFFEDKEKPIDETNENLELLCGLMIEAANTDGKIDNKEIDKIFTILTDIFKENAQKVNLTLERAIQNRDNSKSLFFIICPLSKLLFEKTIIFLVDFS